LKKILIIHHGIGLGGALIALLGLIEDLKKENEISVLCIFESNAVNYIKNTGVNVLLPKSRFYSKLYGVFIHSDASYFEIIDFFRNLKNMVTFFLNKYFFAKKELEELKFNYDIVYLNSTFISDWAFAAKKLNKSIITHIREPLSKGVFGFRKYIIKNNIDRNCNQIIAISVDNAERVGLRKKTTIIYDPVVYKNRNISSLKLHIDLKNKYFLYLGGMQRIKGVEQLVNSLPFLNENIRIFFLGGNFTPPKNKFKQIVSLVDPFMWRIKDLINNLNKSDKIIKVGFVDNIFEYYDNTCALISPFSKPHAALPILEAFSVAKPVIVSDITGMNEIVSVKNGFFFKNGEPMSLATAINNMASLHNIEYSILCENAKCKYNSIVNNNSTVQCIIDKIN
jgi:glycosyltransferase involved in cell wall biosynthesis